MGKSKIRNFIEKSLYIILGAIAVAGIGFGCYKLYVSLFKTQIEEANTDWKKLPPGYEDYSQKHSYKVQLRISDNKASNGTAWSWYWKQQQSNSSLYDWYLITNFHVVNEAIAYNLNLTTEDNSNKVVISDANALLDAYHNKYKFTFDNNNVLDESWFSLYRWKTGSTKDGYTHLLGNSNSTLRNCVKEFSIIADFENNNIDLFSKLNNQNTAQDYNLDMALIKITFDFSSYENPGIPNDNPGIPNENPGIPNENPDIPNENPIIQSYSPVLNFQNSTTAERIYKENKKIFIAGHPVAKQKLVGVEIDSKFDPDYKSLESFEDPILKKLKAPYLYSSNVYTNFPLSGGASGSAVYQDINYPIDSNPNPVQTIDWTKKVPVGIYWGGQSTTNTNTMIPSFIPFIATNQAYGGYNIFINFIDAVKRNEI